MSNQMAISEFKTNIQIESERPIISCYRFEETWERLNWKLQINNTDIHLKITQKLHITVIRRSTYGLRLSRELVASEYELWWRFSTINDKQSSYSWLIIE